MGFPTVSRMYARNELIGTAQNLQAELYRIRLESMKTGNAYIFRCRYGTPLYEVLPKEVFDRREEAKIGTGAISVGPELLEEGNFGDIFSGADGQDGGGWMPESDTTALIDGAYSIYTRQLPIGVIFQAPLPVNSARPPGSGNTSGGLDAENSEYGMSDSGDAVSIGPEMLSDDGKNADFDANPLRSPQYGWSTPILFFPNGRTSQASLTIQTTGRYFYQRQLVLRGLTGTANVVDR